MDSGTRFHIQMSTMRAPPVSIDQYMKGLLQSGPQQSAPGPAGASASAAAGPSPAGPPQQVNLGQVLQQEMAKLQQLNNRKAELVQHLQQIDQALFKQQGAVEMLRRFGAS